MAKEPKRAKGTKDQRRGARTYTVGPAPGIEQGERTVLEVVSMVPGDSASMTEAEVHAMALHDMDREPEHEVELKAGEQLVRASYGADLAQGLARLEDRHLRELRIRPGEQVALVHHGQHHVITAEAAPEGTPGIQLSAADLDVMGISHGDTIILRRLE